MISLVTTSKHPYSSSGNDDKSAVSSNKHTPNFRCGKNLSADHDNEGIAEDNLQATNNGNNNYDSLIPINIVYYEGTEYDLAKTLPTDCQLVKDHILIVEGFKLEKLSRNLSSLGKFAYLACCGVVGHTELQISMREMLISIGDITDDSYHVLKNFERTSKMHFEP